MVADNTLIQQVLRGSRPAFQQLVERYQNYVFTIALKVVRTREEAEEVAQDVFLKVYQQLSTFEEKSKFSTWLYTIAYRTAIDYARRKRPEAHSLDDGDSYLQLEDKQGVNPAEALQREDLKDQLSEAISRLKPVDAAIVTLFYLNDASVKEIAEITALSVSNVKTKLHRLREALRQLLSYQLQSEIEDLL